MGFEDFTENKHGIYTENKYYKNKNYSNNSNAIHQSDYVRENHFKFLEIFEKVKNNKKLQLIIVVAIIIFLSIIIVLIIQFLPVIMKLLNYISQNGIQGVMDSITGFIDKILKGTSK